MFDWFKILRLGVSYDKKVFKVSAVYNNSRRQRIALFAMIHSRQKIFLK